MRKAIAILCVLTLPGAATLAVAQDDAPYPPSAPPLPQQTAPQNTPSPDQQPNPSTQPDATTPHAALLQTPAARAVATHTPDPGTCMNPASLQTSGDGTAVAPPPCR